MQLDRSAEPSARSPVDTGSATAVDTRMETYLKLVRHVIDNGEDRCDRTGVGTRGLFGAQLRFPLVDSFPLLTTRKLHWKSIAHELLWFLRGESNVKSLQENGVSIWNEWATPDGELGPVYGVQWRSWPCPGGSTLDQIQELINGLRERPFSRRHIVSAWNPACLPDEQLAPNQNAANGRMALPPCHALFQFHVANGGRLSCQLYQRSADLFLGVPFNIASYALLTLMVAHVTGLNAVEFIHTFGDVHIYQNHFDQVRRLLDHDERPPLPLPTITLNPAIQSIDDFRFEDIQLNNYKPHGPIKAPIAV